MVSLCSQLCFWRLNLGSAWHRDNPRLWLLILICRLLMSAFANMYMQKVWKFINNNPISHWYFSRNWSCLRPPSMMSYKISSTTATCWFAWLHWRCTSGERTSPMSWAVYNIIRLMDSYVSLSLTSCCPALTLIGSFKFMSGLDTFWDIIFWYKILGNKHKWLGKGGEKIGRNFFFFLQADLSWVISLLYETFSSGNSLESNYTIFFLQEI